MKSQIEAIQAQLTLELFNSNPLDTDANAKKLRQDNFQEAITKLTAEKAVCDQTIKADKDHKRKTKEADKEKQNALIIASLSAINPTIKEVRLL